MAPDKTQAELTEQGNLTDPSEKRIEHIEKALQEWASSGGFRDPGVTLASLSHQLHILRSDLTYYFEQHLQRTFRVWLSDIRFQEVQRMMIQYPDYNNDAISSECGFSSRAHLYRIFKQKTGMTPGEWKASGSYQALGDTDTRWNGAFLMYYVQYATSFTMFVQSAIKPELSRKRHLNTKERDT